jgi:hypothetical protein
MRTWLPLLAAAGLTLDAACGATPSLADAAPPQADAAPPHHRGDSFQNNHVNFQPKGPAALPAWKWQAMLDGLPRALAAARRAGGLTDDEYFVLAGGESRTLSRHAVTSPPGGRATQRPVAVTHSP